MDRSESLVELAKALSKFQGAMRSIPRNSVNPFFKSKYADLDAVWDGVRKPLSDSGLSIVQTTVERDDRIYLETMLLHASGEYITTELALNPKALDPQAVGSAITYARRYAMSALLGVSADEDDDAEKATARGAEAQTAPRDKGFGICPIHHVPWIQSPRMSRPAHAPVSPLMGPQDDWCNKGDVEKAQQATPPVVPTEADLGFGREGAEAETALGGPERGLESGRDDSHAVQGEGPKNRPSGAQRSTPAIGPQGPPPKDFATPGVLWKLLESNGYSTAQVMARIGDLGSWMTSGGTRRSYYERAVAEMSDEVMI